MIQVEGLCLRVGAFALQDVNLEIPAGRYGVLMGKTGCGKTTVLEVVCGLRRPDAGVVRLMGRDVTCLRPAERGIGYVPQDTALFRTMTVAENLGFSLRVRRWSASKAADRVRELGDLLGIAHLLGRRPTGLSGGEAQRVALGRAMAFEPGILCLDEPLSSVDEETRDGLCDLLRLVQRRTGVTVLHVTHNRKEGRVLADHLFRFTNGRIESVLAEASDNAPGDA